MESKPIPDGASNTHHKNDESRTEQCLNIHQATGTPICNWLTFTESGTVLYPHDLVIVYFIMATKISRPGSLSQSCDPNSRLRQNIEFMFSEAKKLESVTCDDFFDIDTGSFFTTWDNSDESWHSHCRVIMQSNDIGRLAKLLRLIRGKIYKIDTVETRLSETAKQKAIARAYEMAFKGLENQINTIRRIHPPLNDLVSKGIISLNVKTDEKIKDEDVSFNESQLFLVDSPGYSRITVRLDWSVKAAQSHESMMDNRAGR